MDAWLYTSFLEAYIVPDSFYCEDLPHWAPIHAAQ